MMAENEHDFDDLLRYKVIRDMSKEELINEMLEAWREDLNQHDSVTLKKYVIELRMSVVKQRLIKEAGLKIETGFMGFPRLVDDEE